ncbi:MAG: hypothetical protein ACC726_03155, partial [Chloroflexota bacterium]
ARSIGEPMLGQRALRGSTVARLEGEYDAMALAASARKPTTMAAVANFRRLFMATPDSRSVGVVRKSQRSRTAGSHPHPAAEGAEMIKRYRCPWATTIDL